MPRTEDGRFGATAYMVSQADLLTGMEFAYGEYRTYQVPVTPIEKLTGLDFGDLRKADPLYGREGVEAARELLSGADIQV
jgi:endonuclease G